MKKKTYKNLTSGIKNIFDTLGFKEISGLGKPYYAGLHQGKILRVIAPNKLKELSDGATETEYGYVKLRQLDGTFKDMSVHRLIAHFLQNKKNKPIVHHKHHLRNRNSIDELEWATYKENTAYYLDYKKTKEDTD